MRILILGAGGVGGYFGARLAAAGVDVRFLVRPARAASLDRAGLVVFSPLGDLRQPVTVLTAATAPVDAVLLTCKAYDLAPAIEAIAPAVGAETVILPMLNGLRHYDALEARFSPRRVLGGLCHLGVTQTPAGEIRHLSPLQRFVLGPRWPEQAEACGRLHQTLSRGGFEPRLSPEIRLETWEKFVLLATYAGMTCLMRAPVGRIMRADEGEALMLEMLAECVAVATGAGYPPRADFLAETRAMLTEPGSPGSASMLRDIERGGRTEGEHILGDMLARARAGGGAAPLLRLAHAHLQVYEAGL